MSRHVGLSSLNFGHSTGYCCPFGLVSARSSASSEPNQHRIKLESTHRSPALSPLRLRSLRTANVRVGRIGCKRPRSARPTMSGNGKVTPGTGERNMRKVSSFSGRRSADGYERNKTWCVGLLFVFYPAQFVHLACHMYPLATLGWLDRVGTLARKLTSGALAHRSAPVTLSP